MKKLISAACAAAFACSITCTAVFAEETHGKLAVLGDSITSGYGLEGYTAGDNSSAADSFSNKLAGDFSDYVNLAVDGRTSAELLEALNSDESFSEAVTDAEAVVISIGGNDFLMPMVNAAQTVFLSNPDILQDIKDGKTTFLEAMAEYEELITESAIAAAEQVDIQLTVDNIGAIVDKVEEISPESEIYLLTVYDPFENIEGKEQYYEASEELLSVLNGGISDISERDNVQLIDVYTAFKGHALDYTNIGANDIHPNKAGHDVIYGLISEALPEVPAVTEETSAPTAETEPAAVTEQVPAAEEAVSSPSTTIPDTGNTGTAPYIAAAALALTTAAALRKRTK